MLKYNSQKNLYQISSNFDIKKAVKNKTEENKKKEKNNIDFNYLNIGYYLITPILVGVVLGFYLDRWFNSRPVFMLSLIILGTAGTFYNLISLTKKN